MATIQDIIAKREELAKTNPNATNVDARKALATPIAPVSTLPEGTTSQDVQKSVNRMGGDASQRQYNRNTILDGQISNQNTPPTVTGVDGQQFTQAPIDPTTGLSKVEPTTPVAPTPAPAPVAPTPAPLPTPAPTQKTEPVDYTQGIGREQEIMTNLEKFKSQGMTPDQIAKASDYQNATPEKKALIEPYLKQQVPTASAMFSGIVSKADIPDEQKASLPYKIAQNRYLKASSLSSMSASQVLNEMKNAKLIEGSQTYEDLKTLNPKLIQDVENLKKVNRTKTSIFTYVNNPDGTSTKVNNIENNFAQDYLDNFGEELKKLYQVQTPEQIRAIIMTPDAVSAQNKATEIELQMNEVESQLKAVDKAVEEELKGTGASANRIALEKASRKEMFQNQLNSLEKNYTTYANKANNIITQNTTLYTTSQAQKTQQANAMLPILQEKYKTQAEKLKAEQALNDPATAIQGVMDEFTKIGIPAMQSLQSKILDAKDFISKGGTLAGYIDKMRSDYMAKPEYKRYKQIQQGQLSDTEKLQATQAFDLKKTAIEQGFQMSLAQAKQTTDQKWTKLDDGMYTNESGQIITADELKTAKLMNNAYVTKQVGELGGQCGFYANRAVGLNGEPGGDDTLAGRMKNYTDRTPAVGGLAFFSGGKYDQKNGHVSFVTAVNADGTITVKESNLKGDEKVSIRTIPASQATGFYNNTPLAQSLQGGTGATETSTTKQYSDSDIAVLDSVTKLDKQGKDTLKSNGFSEREWSNFKAGLLPPTSAQKEESQSVVNKIDNILESDWRNAVGTWKGLPVAGTDRTVVEKKVTALIDSLAATNLDKLKGPMSDKDILFLKNIATYLSPDLSEDEFESTINDIKTRYLKIVKGTPSANLSQPTTQGTGSVTPQETDAVIERLKAKGYL